ncbi:hypothetical protein BDFB_010098, partial [Asbolus verrucosus]
NNSPVARFCAATKILSTQGYFVKLAVLQENKQLTSPKKGVIKQLNMYREEILLPFINQLYDNESELAIFSGRGSSPFSIRHLKPTSSLFWATNH